MLYNIFPEHNLRRTRVRFQLPKKAEEKYDVLNQIIRNTINASPQLTSELI